MSAAKNQSGRVWMDGFYALSKLSNGPQRKWPELTEYQKKRRKLLDEKLMELITAEELQEELKALRKEYGQ